MEILKDKTTLVIGGGSGMGAAIATTLAEAGARVTIAGRRLHKLEKVTDLSAADIQSRTVDVAERASLEALFTWFDEEMGVLDILVNAAGINVPKRSMNELSPDDWDVVLKVNLTGAYDSLRMALNRMRPRKNGLVVMINSVSGKRSNPLGGVAYNASKFGMTGLGSCVAEEERENGIRITNLFPGEVNTPILEQRPVPPSAEHRAGILQPQDIAEAVMMLARLHPRAHIPELVIKPTSQSYV